MFNENYPFLAGSSEYMKKHFKNYANFLVKDYLKSGSKIIEIGSNDGTFLKNLKIIKIIFMGLSHLLM